MSKRNQHLLAKHVGITEAFLSQLVNGARNSSSLIADELAKLTGTDIRVWLKGGDPVDRQAALKEWTP